MEQPGSPPSGSWEVIEQSCSRVNIGDGNRQSLSHQHPEFNAWFFATNQLVICRQRLHDLRYGFIRTAKKSLQDYVGDLQ